MASETYNSYKNSNFNRYNHLQEKVEYSLMWDLFVHPSNLFFSVSLCLMLLLGVVECILWIAGVSSQGFLDQFIPDSLFETHHPDFNVEADHGLWV